MSRAATSRNFSSHRSLTASRSHGAPYRSSSSLNARSSFRPATTTSSFGSSRTSLSSARSSFSHHTTSRLPVSSSSPAFAPHLHSHSAPGFSGSSRYRSHTPATSSLSRENTMGLLIFILIIFLILFVFIISTCYFWLKRRKISNHGADDVDGPKGDFFKKRFASSPSPHVTKTPLRTPNGGDDPAASGSSGIPFIPLKDIKFTDEKNGSESPPPYTVFPN